jgi:hypothetical protein
MYFFFFFCNIQIIFLYATHTRKHLKIKMVVHNFYTNLLNRKHLMNCMQIYKPEWSSLLYAL